MLGFGSPFETAHQATENPTYKRTEAAHNLYEGATMAHELAGAPKSGPPLGEPEVKPFGPSRALGSALGGFGVANGLQEVTHGHGAQGGLDIASGGLNIATGLADGLPKLAGPAGWALSAIAAGNSSTHYTQGIGNAFQQGENAPPSLNPSNPGANIPFVNGLEHAATYGVTHAPGTALAGVENWASEICNTPLGGNNNLPGHQNPSLCGIGQGIYNNVLAPAGGAIGDAAKWGWNNVGSPVVDAVTNNPVTNFVGGIANDLFG